MSSLGKGPWTTKLSSAGLVYAFFGKEAISHSVNKTDEKLLDKVYAKVIEMLSNGMLSKEAWKRKTGCKVYVIVVAWL